MRIESTMDEVNWDFNAPTHIDFSSKEHENDENIEEIEDYFSRFLLIAFLMIFLIFMNGLKSAPKQVNRYHFQCEWFTLGMIWKV